MAGVRLYSVARAVVLEPPGAKGSDSRFALAFGAGERRDVFVFETVDGATKELLVDGLRLLVERTVSAFFDTDEFRVQQQPAPRTPLPARSSSTAASARSTACTRRQATRLVGFIGITNPPKTNLSCCA